MKTLPRLMLAIVAAFGAATAATAANAQERVLNLYSARHYSTDEALYSDFTKTTGIRIQRIEAGDEALLERIRSEGAKSPADVIVLADAARLWKASVDGLFQPIKSKTLESRIPAELRGQSSDAGTDWFSFSRRARVIVYDPSKVKAEEVRTYEDLAKPALKGKLCTRSATHPYMLSLIGMMRERMGTEAATQWASGVVANMARPPRGGDTDQIKGVATGECGVALTNSYYFVRMLRSNNAADREMAQKLGFVWPDQAGGGTHVNVSGGGVAKNAPHRAEAIAFLEYLSSERAQRYFAEGNNEWPVVAGVKTANPALESLGTFKADATPVSSIGRSQIEAQKIIDRVNWR